MTARLNEAPPQLLARLGGVLYLYIIVAGIFAELFVRARFVIPADSVATAGNILANESLFRIGFSGELLHISFDVAVAVILYALFRPVDRNIALLAAFMRLACDIVLAVASLSHFAVLRLLAGSDYLDAVPLEQLQAFALLAMRLHADGYAISLVFFGFACLALGYLVIRSTFFPKAIGALLAIAGVCYLVSSFAQALNPTFAATLFPALFVPIFVAELSLALWLTVKGVDLPKWQQQAGARAMVAPPAA